MMSARPASIAAFFRSDPDALFQYRSDLSAGSPARRRDRGAASVACRYRRGVSRAYRRASTRKLHAYIDVYGDDARLAAEAADKAIRAGHAVGPLHGVPIALKDLIDLEGRVTTGGSMAWRDRRSPVTATLARKLIAAGMIVLGKTHTVEFAMGGWGTNEHLGTPWNPWDLGTRPHAGRVEQRHRRRGRVRHGAVGHRHRHRRLGAAAGVVVRPLGAQDDDRPGQHLWHPAARALARHAGADGALGRGRGLALQRHARSGSARPPHAVGAAPTACDRPGCGAASRGLRLARMPQGERDGCTPEVLAAYDAALDDAGRLGAEIVDLALPCRFADATRAVGRIIGIRGLSAGGQAGRRSCPADRPGGAAAHPARPRVSPRRDYLAALAERDAMKRAFLGGVRGGRRAADADDADTGDPGRFDRPDDDAGASSPALSTCWNYARWRCRTASPRPACRCPCRSSAAPMTRRRRCASAGPISRRPTGTSAIRPAWIKLRAPAGQCGGLGPEAGLRWLAAQHDGQHARILARAARSSTAGAIAAPEAAAGPEARSGTQPQRRQPGAAAPGSSWSSAIAGGSPATVIPAAAAELAKLIAAVNQNDAAPRRGEAGVTAFSTREKPLFAANRPESSGDPLSMLADIHELHHKQSRGVGSCCRHRALGPHHFRPLTLKFR